ncbi:glucose-6-phosphate dehydrogenase [Paracoccus sp. MC1862]|uniref:glucose-6-phosphate dehydrogenase n=1 Tax=Paracoccus sp. MC1862 TaxID=2760307 RepID=UPI0016034793|nr:glucose-6-phosphate dehydrogenase [Paracoccus sp. MC1862]MBB1496676.1 glucose-6-phosphate dehydrogenase [Paracoccus sp. MC1862]QQO43688.1 glucose-6-phosphate dehydrogenase [Paracoccus sp. MC1862]
MASRLTAVDDFDLVIFGATGDLARRKIFPALFRRHSAGHFPDGARIIGTARTPMDDSGFRADIAAAIAEFDPPRAGDPGLPAFLGRLFYVPVDATGAEGWADLAARMRKDVVQAFYLSVAPALFGDIADRLSGHGIAGSDARIVVEKPFGRDLASARGLNRTLARHFTEGQIYRIDHYLGKETVQNLMAIRFANILFEPLWNAHYIDHVQITVAETVGVAGRAAYYDHAGAMRDMVQNHLMQLVCLIAMEPPWRFDPDAVRDEKLKVIRALEPVPESDIVRGQYAADGAGYRADVGNPASRTESFVALKLRLANWRWQGVPFYLRTGKCLAARTSEIAVVFRKPPHSIFDAEERQKPDQLVIRLQPNEGINLMVMIKEPGPGELRLVEVPLDMSFAEALGVDIPDAYERLITEVIRGDQTLFMRGDEVEAAWAWADPVIRAWEEGGAQPASYPPGTSGPDEALGLIGRDGRHWRNLQS